MNCGEGFRSQTGKGNAYHSLALKHLNKEDFGLALGNFLLAARCLPEKISEFQEPVNLCLGQAALWLEQEGRHQELLKIYESVLEVFPKNAKVLNGLGEYLFRHGHVLQSAGHFLRAALADRSLVAARDSLDRANALLVDRWHFTMLNDAARNAAYDAAVRSAVARLAAADLVLDLGAGTGLLSMMAARAGAGAVYACESSEAMAQVGAAVLADNGMSDRVRLIDKPSQQLAVGRDLPKRASLLVTEIFDAGLLGEHALAALDDAWRRLLVPPESGGRVLPAAARLFVSAVESDFLRAQLAAEVDGVPLRRQLDEPYWSERLDRVPGGHRLLTAPLLVHRVDFNDPADVARGLAGLRSRHVAACTAAGRLDALVTWFELELGGGAVLTSAPGRSGCWEQAVYPVPAGRAVLPGQRLQLELSCRGHLQLRLLGPEEEAAAERAEPASAAALALAADARWTAALERSLLRWRAGAPAAARLLDLCPAPVAARRRAAGWSVTAPPAGRDAPPQEVAESWPRLADRAAAAVWDAVICSPVLPSGRLDAAVLEIVRSVRLSPGGLLVPQTLDLLAVAVTSPLVHDMTAVHAENTAGFDCSAINMFTVCQLQEFPYCVETVSADLTAVARISQLSVKTGTLSETQFTLPVTSGGDMHGVVYWFRPTDVAEDEPAPPEGSLQMVAVPREPRQVAPGDAVSGSVHVTADGVFIDIGH